MTISVLFTACPSLNYTPRESISIPSLITLSPALQSLADPLPLDCINPLLTGAWQLNYVGFSGEDLNVQEQQPVK